MIDFSIADEGSADTTLSIAEAKQSLTVFRGKVDALVQEIRNSSVDNEDEAARMSSLGLVASKLQKEIDKKEKEILDEPLIVSVLDFVSFVKNFTKQFKQELKSGVIDSKTKLSSYSSRVELERRKAEEAARKAAEDLQKKLNAEAKEAGVQPVTVGIPVMPEKKQTTRTEEGTSYVVKKWKCEVIDEAAVPIEYKSSDSKKLDRAVESGIREISGCRIFEESNVRFRTA